MNWDNYYKLTDEERKEVRKQIDRQKRIHRYETRQAKESFELFADSYCCEDTIGNLIDKQEQKAYLQEDYTLCSSI